MFSSLYTVLKSDMAETDYRAAEVFAAKYLTPHDLTRIRAHMSTIFPEAEDLPLPVIFLSDRTPTEAFPRLSEEDFLNIHKKLHLAPPEYVIGFEDVVYPVFSRFESDLNLIVLYFKQLETCPDPASQVQLCLARELFHTLQNRSTDKYTYGELGSVVTEASADFYAYLYGKESREAGLMQAAEEKYRSWKENLICERPYSSALYFTETEGLRGADKLRYVFLQSYKGMRAAFDALQSRKKRNLSPVHKYIKENYLEEKESRSGFNLESGQFGFRFVTKDMEAEENQYKNDERFRSMVMKLMDEHAVENAADVYEGANLSKDVWASVMKEKKQTTKAEALAIAMSLKLSLAETRELLSAFGYTLSNSSKYDLIIMYYIEAEKYDLYAVNDTLREFGYDQLLGGGRSAENRE